MNRSHLLTSKFKLDPSSYTRSKVTSRYSCLECRKNKKKCSKDLGGCFNCIRLKRRCTYDKGSHQLSSVEVVYDIPPLQEPAPEPVPEPQNNSFIHSKPNSAKPQVHPNFLLKTLGFSELILGKVDHLKCPQIPKSLAYKFVEAFFKHNYRSYPFICKAVFVERFEQVDHLEDTISNYFEFETYMIMAIGCTTLSRVGLLQQEDVSGKYFAYKCIGYLSQGNVISDLDLIKMLLLLCIYSFFEPEGLQTWNLFGILSRNAISLGLYRTSKISQRSLEDEMKTRLFWSIHNMDRLLSISLGRPLSIDDNNIDMPLPTKLNDEENFTYKTILAIIELRKIEGNIISKLYSSRAREIYSKDNIERIKLDLKDWIDKNQPHSPENLSYFSFHISDCWYLTRFYHNLMLLYRPSYLVPTPDMEQLNLLGQYCLKTLSSTHKLFKANLLPLNWITLYRFLTLCSSLLYCLCNWSIDLNESKSEIYLSVEILNAFSENWIFASKCSKVFQNIVDNILEVSLTASGDEVSKVKQLSNELLGASSAYHEILDNNSVNMPFTNLLSLPGES